ncbi:MAG: AAA family ATPase, partial [bacterium]
MLRLDSLEITGFKSFADKTRVDLPNGITTIIGPNGCGKSNLSDAIGWVLGLHSARNLRGQKMEDVIFNGTDQRRPSGVVEVKLRLKRQDDTPLVWGGVELQEEILEITRKLYRSGEGHSRINGRRCRLKDIHQLLSDAGLGSTSYAMIAQGKIDTFLTSRPLDRRAIIEEAAQIIGYKNKRRNAELKLEMAKQNLLRVNDIIAEVERQLRSLKRQANKAKRYRKLKDEFQSLQGQRFAVESVALNRELDQLNQEARKREEEETDFRVKLDRDEAIHRKATQERDELEMALTGLRQRRSEIQLELDRAENSARYHQEQINLTEESLRTDTIEFQSLQESLGELEQEGNELTAERTRVQKESLAVEKAVEQGRNKAQSVGRQVDDAEEHLEELRTNLVHVSAEAAALRNEKGQVQDRLKSFRSDHERLGTERSRAIRELNQVRSDLKEKEFLRKSQEEELELLRVSVNQCELEKRRLESDTAGLSEQ